jgi:hypothetical protein
MPSQYVSQQNASPTRVNKRATVRYQCAPATPGRVIVAEDQEFQRAWVLDLSVKGIGLQLTRPLKAGTLVVIQMKSSQKKIYDLAAQVAHATAMSCGDWVVGCELIQRLSQEELDDLLS